MTFWPPFGEEFHAGGRVGSVASSRTEIEKVTLHETQKLLPGTKMGGGYKSCFYDFILSVVRHG